MTAQPDAPVALARAAQRRTADALQLLQPTAAISPRYPFVVAARRYATLAATFAALAEAPPPQLDGRPASPSSASLDADAADEYADLTERYTRAALRTAEEPENTGIPANSSAAQ